MSVGRLPSSNFSMQSVNNQTGLGQRYQPYRRPLSATGMHANAQGQLGSHGRGVSPPESPVQGGDQLYHGMSNHGGELFAGSSPVGTLPNPVAALGGRAGSPWPQTPSVHDRAASETRLAPYGAPAGDPGSGRERLCSTSLGLQDVEMMCRNLGLEADRQCIYNFHELSMDSKLTALFMHTRAVDGKLEKATKAYYEIQVQLVSIHKLVQQAWQPSKAQSVLIRSLVRHFVIKPIVSYNHITHYVKDYVRDHAIKLRLGLYLEDQTVKVTLNATINELTIQAKSAVRKAIFASIKKRIPLVMFCRSMLDNYHLPAIPAEVPLAILGTFAFLRQIAEPLTRRKSNGGDTGFWREVEETLAGVYRKFKVANRDDPVWTLWAEEHVAQDQDNYPATGIQALPTTREEMNRVLGLTADGEESVELESPEHAPAPEDAAQRRRVPEDAMDGEVSIAELGDVATTVQLQ